MALVYIIVAIVGAAFAGGAVYSPYVDGDLFWQRHLGEYVLMHHALPTALGNETFSAPGAPWVPQEWLLGVADALASHYGALWVLAVAAAGALVLAVTIDVARARRFGAASLAIAATLAALIVDVQASFGIRAQVFAWPFFTGLLLLLDLSGNVVFFAIPLVVVWANVHASVMAAIPIVWIDAVVTACRRGVRDAETGRRCVLSLLVPLATLATPLGVKLPIYAMMLVGSPIRRFIDEWQPIGLHSAFFWYGAFPMILAVLCCGRKLLREHPRDAILIVILTAMTIGAVRNAPLLGFVLMPMAAPALDVLFGRFAFWNVDPVRSAGPRRLAVFGGAVLAVVVFFVAARGAAPGAVVWRPAVDAFGKLSAMPGAHRLFCYDFAVCSPALDFPTLRVYMDGRADPYPPPIWYDFDTMRYARSGWHDVVAKYDINAVYVKRKDKLDAALEKERDWKLIVTAERCCHLYVRRPGP